MASSNGFGSRSNGSRSAGLARAMRPSADVGGPSARSPRGVSARCCRLCRDLARPGVSTPLPRGIHRRRKMAASTGLAQPCGELAAARVRLERPAPEQSRRGRAEPQAQRRSPGVSRMDRERNLPESTPAGQGTPGLMLGPSRHRGRRSPRKSSSGSRDPGPTAIRPGESPRSRTLRPVLQTCSSIAHYL